MSQYHPPNHQIAPSTQNPGGWRPLHIRPDQQRQLPHYFILPKRKAAITIKSTTVDAIAPIIDENPSSPSSVDSEQVGSTHGPGTGSNEVSEESATRSTDKLQGISVAKESQLNIFAPIHIPDWLVAVNESAAATVACAPLRHFDALEYAAMIGANVHIEANGLLPLPSGSLTTGRQTIVKPQNYQDHFLDVLRDEATALKHHLLHLSLYNHQIVAWDKAQRLFEVHVPGLREDSPRIDLGDIVLVRPINQMSSSTAQTQNKMWRDHMQKRGVPHPAFGGTEYQTVVWGVARAKEALFLRVDISSPLQPTANLKFVLQEPKWMPFLRAVQTVDAAMKNSGALRSMLFPQRSDACMQTKLSTVTFDIDWKDKVLNFEQQKTIAAVVADKYGTVPFLISGPPGTGKTKTMVEIAHQLIGRKKSGVDPHLLICAPSDAAADTIALRLSDHLDKDQLFRLNGWTRSFAEVPDKLLLHSFTDSHNLFGLPPFLRLMSYKVVVTTCRDAKMLVEARLTNNDLSELAFNSLRAVSPSAAEELTTPILHWTALLLDEAAQATEPESLIPLSVIMPISQIPGCETVFPQFILAGDEFQLGPRLVFYARKPGLEVSLFQRLFNLPFYADHPLSRANGLQPLTRKLLPLPRPAFANLIRNYRSHPAILSVPSSLFYFDTLVPESTSLSPTTSTWPGWRKSSWPVLFVQNSGPDDVDDILVGDGTGVGSLYNNDEIGIVLSKARTLFRHIADLRHEEVMIMSHCSAQVARIRRALRKEAMAAVNVGPLEAFQGLEGRIVILCTTRTRRGPKYDEAKFVKMDQDRGLGVIDEPKRFNMAITRAREGLIIIGDSRTLVCTGDPSWRNLIAFCVRNGLVEGDIIEIRDEIEGWDVKEGRLERGLRHKEAGATQNGVIGLRYLENAEEEGEMILLGSSESEDDEGIEEVDSVEEPEDAIESEKEVLSDVYNTLQSLSLGGAPL